MFSRCHLVSKIAWNNVGHYVLYRKFATSQALSVIGPRRYSEEKYRKMDKISKDFELIYKAPMENYLSFAKYFTTGSVSIITTAIAVRIYLGIPPFETPQYLLYGKLLTDESELKIFFGGFLLITILLRIFINSYALRIYKNDDKYVAIFQGQLPFTKKFIEFKQGDVMEVPGSGTIIPWRDSRFKIKHKSVTMLPNNFKTPSELFEMMVKQGTKRDDKL